MDPELEFNWYEDITEVEVDEFVPVDKERYKGNKVYDTVCFIFKYISIVSILIYGFRYITNKGPSYIQGVRINAILLASAIFFGSLNVISAGLYTLIQIFSFLGADLFIKRVKCTYRWVSLVIWFILSLYLSNNVKEDFGVLFFYVRSFLISGILTSVVFSVLTLLMQLFYESFVSKSLYAKMKEVDLKERLLAVMKSYRYEISDSSESEDKEYTCVDMLCGSGGEPNSDSDSNASHINLRQTEETSVGSLYFKPPEIHSIVDAKTLAKDVFEKATGGKEELSFNDFSVMFPNTQIALQAFSYFDVNDDRSVSKKEFRDTILQFYLDRVNLEQGFEIAKGFVDIVSDILSIVVLGFLLLAYLVIFGVSLKDLLALALSSALVLNFAVSGMAVDLYFNFMVLLSHPFDIGDEILIDGKDFTVHKIGLNSTAFLGKNGGKVKFINSVLWKKSLVNMTRAPEKVILFTFDIDSKISIDKFRDLKKEIHSYLKKRSFDFYETFSLEGNSESDTDINTLKCTLILKCKSYRNKTKKFQLRMEINKVMLSILDDLEIPQK